MTKRVLVLGGYGNFGRLIATELALRKDIHLIIAGRRREQAIQFCEALKNRAANCELTPLTLDIHSDTLRQTLLHTQPDLVIHTSGPFQGQNYQVPKLCLDCGSHYIDLADDRRFVSQFQTLDKLAKERELIAISGASSVPGISSTVIDFYAEELQRLDMIDYCITPGSNVDLGQATVTGILSYVGHPFKSWNDGEWKDIYGWMNIRRQDLGESLNKRWLANVDIPDLELFPERYQSVKTVRFQAGHELTIVHITLALMGLLAKFNVVKHWDNYASLIYKVGRLVKGLGSDRGGMVIRLSGANNSGQPQTTIWRLIAEKGVGPHIPTIPAIILANKILDNTLTEPMATPCLGMFSLDELSAITTKWGIYQELEQKIE